MGSRETASASVDDGGTKPMMMEGWLYLIQSNCVGLQFLRKHYFVLKGHHLRSYKYLLALSRNNNNHQLLPLRSAVLDSTIRVLDKGRETIKIEKPSGSTSIGLVEWMPKSSMLGSIGSKECKTKKLNWGLVQHTHITIVVHLSSSGELTRSIGLSLKEGDVNSDSQRQNHQTVMSWKMDGCLIVVTRSLW
ncbi:hypothetical protein Ahy_B08g093764 isoform A [Arachis hypogaea]|uniref:PH domain-containing protein n=1 Tax=Arachis hypogaea TaxID=3818 RepID=A0A444Y6X2_ARAHY|nr:hypothetical protein Ahy_B08g093764 isoform A [Arachis hypogaea]